MPSTSQHWWEDIISVWWLQCARRRYIVYFNESMSVENFKSIYNFPFYLEQKQLITVCGNICSSPYSCRSWLIYYWLKPIPCHFDKPNVILNTSLQSCLLICPEIIHPATKNFRVYANAIGETEVYQQRYNNVWR